MIHSERRVLFESEISSSADERASLCQMQTASGLVGHVGGLVGHVEMSSTVTAVSSSSSTASDVAWVDEVTTTVTSLLYTPQRHHAGL